MTESPDEYGDLLRRVLRAEADSVVPSAEGLQIIRTRVEQRGPRGIFWWRAAASAFGAVLVAAAIVTFVPSLRGDGGDPQPIMPVQYDTDPPEESSTSRPPNVLPPTTGGSSRPLPTTPTPTGTTPPPKPSTIPSPGTTCATGAPGDATSCPAPSESDADPEGRTTEPKPRPTQSKTPTKAPTPAAPTEPTPTAAEPTATATITPQMHTEAPSDAPAQDQSSSTG